MINECKILTDNSYKINNSTIDFDLPTKISSFKNVEVLNNNLRTIEPYSISFKHGMSKDIYQSNKLYNNHTMYLRTYNNAKLELEYNFNKDNHTLNNLLVIEAFNDCEINIVYKSKEDLISKFYHNGYIYIKSLNNIKVTLNIINLLNNKSINLDSIESNINSNSTVNINYIDLGAFKSYNNIYNNNDAINSTSNTNILYMGELNEYKDINILSSLRKEETRANIICEGVLNNTSTKNFKGVIDFKKGALHSKGIEHEYTTLLSKDATSKSLPILLCGESLVEGTHSSACGEIDKEQIFYLKSRGLDENSSKNILVKSRFNKILNNINHITYIEDIYNAIERKLEI